MRVKKGDFLIAGIILIMAASIFIIFFSKPATEVTANITVGGELREKIILTGLAKPVSYIITENGYTNEILAENGRISVIHSNCPDQVCVHTGFIKTPGQSIVCLKTKLVITLHSRDDSGIDAVIG